jgi:plasmid maintenance system antidote protein VapI
MEDVMNYPFKPDWTIAPAATLQDWMNENHLTATTLANVCSGPMMNRHACLARIKYILDKRPMTPEVAAMLQRGTSIPAKFWLTLEHNYRAGLKAGLTDAT